VPFLTETGEFLRRNAFSPVLCLNKVVTTYNTLTSCKFNTKSHCGFSTSCHLNVIRVLGPHNSVQVTQLKSKPVTLWCTSVTLEWTPKSGHETITHRTSSHISEKLGHVLSLPHEWRMINITYII